jgi:RNA polymerase sigma-70 factor (ECF subfamily)
MNALPEDDALNTDCDRTTAPSASASAPERLFPLVYDELHAIAERHFRREPTGHTLQPTALVHEAYVRLARGTPVEFTSRSHFMAIAARAMRHLLVDRARRKGTEKHGGGWSRVTLDEALCSDGDRSIDLIRLNDALEKLTMLDERKGRIIELRFFAGLTIDETAAAINAAPSTVTEDWRMARAWLVRELGREAEA